MREAMTREQYINNFKKYYLLVHLLADKIDHQIYHFRNKMLNKDIVLRSYSKRTTAYEKIVNIRTDNLPEIYDTITLEDGMIVLEEFIDGITIAQVMESKRYKYSGAAKIIKSVCHALTVLHGQNIVHRDIKPENIMIDKNGRVVLIDFNASRKISKASQDTVIMGTIGYASPEQLGISQSDMRTDIYALGILLNVMLTGKHPVEKLAKGKAEKVIRKCTNLNPDERYQTVEKLSKAL